MIRTKKSTIGQEKPKHTYKDLKNILTDKQKHFCHEYVKNGWNGSQAALRAGYSKNTAGAIACENLKKLEIIQYIDYIKEDIEMLCNVSKSRQIAEFSKIAYSNIADLHNTWISLKDFDSLTSEQKAAIETIETKVEQNIVNKEVVETKYIKIKLHNKIAALEAINKLMGYNEAKKIDVTAKVENIPVNLANLTDEEIRMYAKINSKIKGE